MKNSRRAPKAKPHAHISQRLLKQRMSEVISLRERLAQAELQAGRVPTFPKEPVMELGKRQTRENA